MVEINNLGSPRLAEAVRLWTGWGQSMMPGRNDNRVMERFGEKDTAKLLPLIRTLKEDFYASDAHVVAASLQEMGNMASEDFKRKHPGVAEDIVKAFAWCYTFDFK